MDLNLNLSNTDQISETFNIDPERAEHLLRYLNVALMQYFAMRSDNSAQLYDRLYKACRDVNEVAFMSVCATTNLWQHRAAMRVFDFQNINVN